MRATKTERAMAVAVLVLASGGCNAAAKRVGDHFLEAVAREDWAAAYAELYPDARASTPSVDVLRARFEGGGSKLVSWYDNCGNGGELARIGYNVTKSVPTKAAAPVRPVMVGVPPRSHPETASPA